MRRLLASALLALPLLAATPAAAQIVPPPAAPQPDEAALQAGLSVKYNYQLTRDVSTVEGYARNDKGKAGPPLMHLDWKTGEDKVLTSDGYDGVLATIRGYILLEEEGLHDFAMETNDGTRVTIGGKMIMEDGDVHPDRFSEVIEVIVEEPGWYPIEILYFERKNTSTLRVLMRTPYGANLDPVDPELLAHIPE